MARRNVELVIRARDEAKTALTAINKALDDFSGNTQRVRDEASKTDTRLDSLGSAFRELRQAVGQLGATGQVERQLRNITGEITRQEAAIQRTEAALQDYSSRFAQTRSETDRLAATQARLSGELERGKAAVERSQAAQRALASATGQAQRAQDQYAARQNKLNEQITRQNQKLQEYETRLASLRGEIANTAKPTAALVRNFERTEKAIGNTRARINDLVETQRLISVESDRAARSVQRANTIYGSQAAALDRNQAALERTEQAYRESAAAAKASATEQARLEAAAKKSAGSLEQQNAALQRARSAYEQTQATVRETADALSRLDAETRRGLLRSLREQITRVSDARQSYRELSAEASRLGNELRKTTNPTNAQVQAFERFRVAAAQARQEFRAQGQALSNLRSVLRETGGDVDTISSRVQRFQNVLQGARSGYAGLQQSSQAAAAAAARLAREQGRAAGNTERLRGGTDRLGASMRQGARSTGLFANAIRQFYGETRTALGFTQRLRGEVLSLIAAYGGFFAAIEGIRGVVNAYRTLEQAQNRLNAVFDNDEIAVGNEIDFLRRTADRLGIQFGVLSQEYTKFAVATQGTNLEGENTRNIFRQVAEAARVQGLSLDNLQGVFVALTQIVSKGTVSMEELRQQLGDRLPGALQILAAGLGKTTEELIDLIENGELSSDSLIAFGDELERRFSGQLPAALEGVNTAIGRFENAIFNAFVTIGQGGAIEGFADLLNDLVDALDTAAVQDFLTNVGAGLQQFFNILGLVVENWDLLIVAITTFIGLKIAPFVVAIIGLMGRWQAIVRLARIRTATLTGALGGLAGGARGAAGALTALRGSLTLLLSSTGIGLLVTLIGTGIGVWATRGSEATEVMIQHRRIIDSVRNAYDQVGDSITEIRDRLSNLTAIQVEGQIREAARQFESALSEFEDAIPRNIFGNIIDNDRIGGFFTEVDALTQRLRDGEIDVAEFRSELEDLSLEMRDNVPINAEMADQFDALARALVEPGENLEELRDVLIVLTGDEEEAEAALRRLSGAVEDTGDAATEAASQAEQFGAALRRLQEEVPGLVEELDRLDQINVLARLRDEALALATNTEEAIAALEAYRLGIANLDSEGIFAGASGSVEASAALLRNREGFRETPYWDVNALRIGFGSDTITLSDGTVQRVVEGMRVSVADANRDLIRRIGEFQGVVRGQIGGARFESFSDQQQAVLTSIAYNYGSLPGRIIEAVRTGSSEEIATAIRGLQNDNEGVNRERRLQEADIFQLGGAADFGPYVEAERERTRLAERAAAQAEREAEATARRIADAQFGIEQQTLLNNGREREAAIAEAIREARQENANITEAEIAQVAELAGRQFDLQAQEEAATTQRERAREVETQINELVQQRTALQSLLEQQIARGVSADAIEETRAGLASVNEQLQSAIENALQLLLTFDQTDPAVAAIVARMQELQVEGQTAAQGIRISFQDLSQAFTGAFTNAVNGFANAIANGKSATDALANAFRQFAADFLRQIAQMILQQLALNAAQAIGRMFGFSVGVSHSGGIIGALGAGLKVSPASFAGAMRYHSGGIAGLRPNEVPTILERNEEVLTTSDPRHAFNMGKGGGSGGARGGSIKIVNALNSEDLVSEGLSSRRGEQAVLNVIRSNSSVVKGVLDG